MFDELFTPIKIRSMELKNRIVLPAMGSKFVAGTSEVNQQMIDYHVLRVENGCALNMSECCSIYPYTAPTNYLSISKDKYIPGLKKLTDAIHQAGGKAGVQFWIPGLAAGGDPTCKLLVPSDTPLAPNFTLPGISKEEIKAVVEACGLAAKRAVEAGFDCIEYHAAHNYLPHSFLSAAFNHRQDEYGGSLENRMRFVLECLVEIRRNIPEDMPLFMRIGAKDDCLENGLTIEDVIEICKAAGKVGVDVLDISRGNFSSAAMAYEVPPIDLPRGFNVDNAAKIKKETGMITMAVGRINTPTLANDIVAQGKADMVVMGRAQLADPAFISKAKAGELDEIDYCIGCDQGCLDGNTYPNIPFITCLRNPALGREKECTIVKTNNPKKVLIAGGGIGGLEAALTLKEIGHEPIIVEKSDKLGGQFLLAGQAPRKAEMKEAVIAMANKAKKHGIEIHLNQEVNEDLIKEIKPDALFSCIGSKEIVPNIKGIDQSYIKKSHDILSGKEKIAGKVVVIGGGMVGGEVAEYLAKQGLQVSIVEMLDEICKDLGTGRKPCVLGALAMEKVEMLTGVKVEEFADHKVIGKKEEHTITLDCDYAVLALGVKPLDSTSLENICQKEGIKFVLIGDAKKAGKAIDATRDAYDAALTFDK